MLKKAISPGRTETEFTYDALGRRTAKIHQGKITRFIWDGDVPLHEWQYDLEYRPEPIVDDIGTLRYEQLEPVDLKGLVTWVFEDGTYIPNAKIKGDKHYSIVCDYLGTPVEAYDEEGERVWQCELDIYGNVRKLVGDRSLIPLRFQGQYEDEETGLYYNRFRYYSASSGTYISQDPIGLLGNNPNLYAYTIDSNVWIDPFGLNVQTGKGRTSVKYSGIKDGKPYHGFASAPTDDGLSGQDIVARRYSSNFDEFDVAPEVDYVGKDEIGKQTARGLEQRGFEKDGGLKGTSNKQNPVGPNNANRQKYLDAADAHQKSKVKASCN
ncbi:MAG: RHS domain-containing protein [Cytophagales bacterium]|nr:RHS domain-containing protein [Cytophagales bacterium]